MLVTVDFLVGKEVYFPCISNLVYDKSIKNEENTAFHLTRRFEFLESDIL